MAAQDLLKLDRLEMLKLLYPWYKEEVYSRRQQMIWLTAVTNLALLSLLFVIAALPPPRPTYRAWGVLASIGVLIFSGCMVSVIFQQRARHRLAKQVLIKIEQALGLYEEGRHPEQEAFYPEDWQTAWRRDRSLLLYLGTVLTLTLLVVLALILR